jgi:hypothetical protein
MLEELMALLRKWRIRQERYESLERMFGSLKAERFAEWLHLN